MRYLALFLMLAGFVFGAEDVQNGATDVITYFVLTDRTTGLRDTGVTIANLEMYYVEDQAAESADAFVGAHGAVTDAHTDGECIHVGHGLYRFDWPDAAFDGGIGKRVQLTVVDGDGGAKTETLVVQLSPPVNVISAGGTAQTGNDNGADINTLITQVGTAGDGLTNINLPNQTMDITGDITGNLSGSVGSLTGHTVQTGDTYALANNGTYGFSALEGLVDDLESRLTAARAGYLDALNGHTAQTGDTYALANNGTYGFSALEGLVDDIGAAGAGLTAITSKTNNLPTDPADASVVAGLIGTAQTDLDTITGADGVTLATAQGLYAPAKAGDLMGLSNDAITAAKVTDAAWQELIELLFDYDATATYATADDGSLVKQIGSNATVTIPPRLD